jgi:hypothetical protein
MSPITKQCDIIYTVAWIADFGASGWTNKFKAFQRVLTLSLRLSLMISDLPSFGFNVKEFSALIVELNNNLDIHLRSWYCASYWVLRGSGKT